MRLVNPPENPKPERAWENRAAQFGEFGENQQGNFVIIDFTFTNNSAEALTLDTVSMALVDGEG
ncbi:MAG: hypothetical protein H0U65_07005, partial [Rubrobacter sp.]|nr:hypothetical protein [Rubrobacter sp.]